MSRWHSSVRTRNRLRLRLRLHLPHPRSGRIRWQFVRTRDDPVVLPLFEGFTQGEWRPVQEAFDAGMSWSDRNTIFYELGDVDAFPDDWISAMPDSGTPLTARGAFYIRHAWKERGTGRAHNVTDEGWRGFTEYLDLALADLQRAVELSPDDPTPWASMISVAMGLSLPKDEILRLVAEADLRSPGLACVYSRATTALAQKWGGSHRLMFDFAEDTTRRLPDGSAGLTCVAYAHVEAYTYLKNFDKDKVATKAHFKSPSVAAQVGDAADRSVLSAAYLPDLSSPVQRSYFAFCLTFIGDTFREHRAASSQLFQMLGDAVPESPWTLAYGFTAAPQVCAGVRKVALNRVQH